MNSRNNMILGQAIIRHFCKTGARAQTEVASARYNQLKGKQSKFQIDDGVPSYLKAGFGDKALFALTAGLVTIGTGWGFSTLWVMSAPKN
ncbi:PREDICTED: cytochrome c oxidase subunit 7A1, mitochondrial-like [Nicrophorus vespilloides]|uniref:Cytochrome c oxidase subunit 7A1, mitochondrial-like n=1 Tax=Nicrophorus vespilloides TaxID=110193 RepID=A0ABM1MAM6_NICVS|nr:PREDICTED: cytochrome c oxidase subunit 7A1, mitochondrial-like [Nicrophorus vespilloides]